MTTATPPMSTRAGRRAAEHGARHGASPAPTTSLLTRLRPTRDHLVDLAGCGALVVIALVGFRTTYFGWQWFAVAVLGVLLGLAISHLTAALRLPGVFAALAVVVTYLLVGAPLASGEGASTRGLSTIARTAVNGWKDLLTTLPPVDPGGPLTALPWAFGLVGGATAYGVARRWPGAMRALLVPTALLVLAILLGTMTPASLALLGGGFGLVAIGYAAARAARGRPALQSGAGRMTRAITAGVLLALALGGALVVGPRLPGADSAARTVWRTALEPPFDVAQFPSPLAGYRRFTEPNPAALFDRTLLTVTGLPAGVPLRIATLDSYDGAVWGAGAAPVAVAGRSATAAGTTAGTATTASATNAFRRVGQQLGVTPAAGATDPVPITVEIPEGGWQDVWLPTAGLVSEIHFEGARAQALHDDLRFNVGTSTGLIPARLGPGDTYQLTAYLPGAGAELPADMPLATTSTGDTQPLAFLDARIDQWTGRDTDPWRKLLSAAAVLRGTGAYTDGGPPNDFQNAFLPGHSLARVTRFVKAPQLAGNDEQYAATLALIAARIGVPARVVLGAIPDSTGIVKGKDVRAWVQVQRADGTWQDILPTQLVPDRTKKPNQQDQRTEEKKTGAVVPPPAANNPPSILQGPDQVQNAAGINKPGQGGSIFDPATWPDWLRWILTRLGPPLLALALWYAVVSLLKVRRRRRRRTSGTGADQAAGAWAELVDVARDRRIALPPNATRPAQARALQALIGPPSARGAEGGGAEGRGVRGIPDLTELARATDSHVFARLQPAPEAVAADWAASAAAAAALRASGRRRDRIRAAWSVRSLRKPLVTIVRTRAAADAAALALRARRLARTLGKTRTPSLPTGGSR